MASSLDTLSGKPADQNRKQEEREEKKPFDDSSVRNEWKKLGYVNEYDSGVLFSGISENEYTSKDFVSKLSNALAGILKNTETGKERSKYSSSSVEMLKSCLVFYQQIWNEKSSGEKDDIKMIAALHGFINGYVKNGNIDSKV